MALLAVGLAGLPFSSGGLAAARDRTPVVDAKPSPLPEGPLTIVISIRDQRLTLYSGISQIARVPISSGTRGHETPTGIFSVIQKARMHYSNLYNSAPMPFMQRLTWSGVALHAGFLPGYAASHGCVRMPHDFARRLFDQTKPGARVIVTHGDVAPATFAHPSLTALASLSQQVVNDRPLPPMHLGGAPSTDEPATAPAAAVTPDAKPSRSLLKKAQLAVAERSLAIEAGRAVKAAAGQRLDEAVQLVQQAREAALPGRIEIAKARARVLRIEAEIRALEGQLLSLARSAVDTQAAAATEDLVEARLLVLIGELESARKEADDKDETQREITEELAIAERMRAEASLANEDAAFRLKLAEEALKEARRDLVKRQQPVSLFVSRKTGKLYVRQGFEPLLEAQVAIADPDTPVGTHVYTALAAADAGTPARWTAMTVPAALGQPERAALAPQRRTAPGARERGSEPSVSSVAPTAKAALDRLQLPAEVAEQLADLIKAGSSLIISDQPLSQETGKYTDLIVQTQ